VNIERLLLVSACHIIAKEYSKAHHYSVLCQPCSYVHEGASILYFLGNLKRNKTENDSHWKKVFSFCKNFEKYGFFVLAFYVRKIFWQKSNMGIKNYFIPESVPGILLLPTGPSLRQGPFYLQSQTCFFISVSQGAV
jgi:hypothetical protein